MSKCCLFFLILSLQILKQGQQDCQRSPVFCAFEICPSFCAMHFYFQQIFFIFINNMRRFHNHFCNFKRILSRRFRKITLSQLNSSNSFLSCLPPTHLLNISPMYKFKKFYRQTRTNDYSFLLLQHVSKLFFLEIPTFSHESQLSRFIIRTNFDFPQP